MSEDRADEIEAVENTVMDLLQELALGADSAHSTARTLVRDWYCNRSSKLLTQLETLSQPDPEEPTPEDETETGKEPSANDNNPAPRATRKKRA